MLRATEEHPCLPGGWFDLSIAGITVNLDTILSRSLSELCLHLSSEDIAKPACKRLYATVSIGPSLCSEWSVSVAGTECWFR